METKTNPAVQNEGVAARVAQPAAEKKDAEKRLWLNVTDLEEADVEELLETLTFYAGETEVYFVTGRTKSRCSQKVSPNKALMAELISFLPENCIKLL